MGVDHTVVPEEQADASDLHKLAEALATGTGLSVMTADGAELALRPEIRSVLSLAVQALSDGHAVTVEPRSVVLSTQEAADMLGVSRPTLVKLLQAGEIPYTQPSRHRRIRIQDLLDYQRRLRIHQREVLAAMGAAAIADDIYGHLNEYPESR